MTISQCILVALYLMIGLGIFFGRLSAGGNMEVSAKNLLLGVPYGVLVGAFVTIVWPFYLAGMISYKLSQ